MNRHQSMIVNSTMMGHDRGASLVEYVLLISLIVLVCLASLTAFGSSVGDNIDDSASRVVTAVG